MKLSHLALSALLLAVSATGIQATQQEPQRPKTETKTKPQRKRQEPVKKTVKKDTAKIKGTNPSHKIISPDYCPPCGMG